jgi:hypothetical protein
MFAYANERKRFHIHLEEGGWAMAGVAGGERLQDEATTPEVPVLSQEDCGRWMRRLRKLIEELPAGAVIELSGGARPT